MARPLLIMLLPSLALLASISSVLALKSPGQIPVIDGVIGGVGHQTVKTKPALEPLATTPGKLRTVENSGICGVSD